MCRSMFLEALFVTTKKPKQPDSHSTVGDTFDSEVYHLGGPCHGMTES